jgi:hypothetical protein
LHRIAARLRFGLKPRSHGWVANGDRGRFPNLIAHCDEIIAER